MFQVFIRILFVFLFFVTLPSPLKAKGLAEAVFHPKVQEAIEKNAHHQWYIAATMIFRDDAPYLKEWIEYHRLLGVEHFYLYNNLSQDDYAKVLSPYIEQGIVELIDWPYESVNVKDWDRIQLRSYQDAHKRAMGKVKWLAILDSDEFLVPAYETHLKPFLDRHEGPDIGSVTAFWVVFGTSWVKKIPENRLTIETLLLNGGYSHGLYKHIIRPERVKVISSAHLSTYKPGFQTKILPYEEMQVNHYWSRDEYYLESYKIPLREKWGTSRETTLSWAAAGNNDTSAGGVILRFVPELRKRMGFDAP